MPNANRREKETDKDTAELKTEENKGLAHMSDGDREMQRFLEILLAPTNDTVNQ